MTRIKKILYQNKIYQPDKKARNNDNKSCRSGYWLVENDHYGNSTCSKVNPNTCPIIGNNNGIAKFTSTPPEVECTYNTNDFTKNKHVKTYEEIWGKDEDYNDKIMPEFCQEISASCPIDPDTNEQMQACSNLISTDRSGRRCRDWAKKNPELADKIKHSYCKLEYATNDCGCINREQEPNYRLVKSKINPNSGINDSVWYKPCQNEISFLLPNEIQNGICPNGGHDHIMEFIVNARREIGSDDIRQAEFNKKIACDENYGNSPPHSPSRSRSPSPSRSPSRSPSPSVNEEIIHKKNDKLNEKTGKGAIIIIFIIIVIFLLIMTGYILYKKHKLKNFKK